MFSVMIKDKNGDTLVEGEQVVFVDNPIPVEGGFAGGVLTIKDGKFSPIHEFNAGIAYVMNDKGKTIATYHLSLA